MPDKRQNLYKIFLTAAAIVLGLVIAEYTAGLYIKGSKLDKKLEYIKEQLSDSRKPLIGSYDELLGWAFEPNMEERERACDFDVLYSINSFGIRDREVPLYKSKEEYRIIALGESTVFGAGINYGSRFTEVMESALSHVNVINMGVWGFGIDQSLLFFERDGIQYKPDLVILFVMRDYLARSKDYIRDDVYKPRFVLNRDKQSLVLQNIHFLRKKFASADDSLSSQRSKEKTGFEDLNKGSSILALINHYKKYRGVKKDAKESDKEYWDSLYERLAPAKMARRMYNTADFEKLIYLFLQMYQNICSEHKSDFLVVNIEPYPTSLVSDICKRLDIRYLDLSAVLWKAGLFRCLRFEIDPHYNDFAHRVIGEYTAEYLKDRYHLKGNKSYDHLFLGRF